MVGCDYNMGAAQTNKWAPNKPPCTDFSLDKFLRDFLNLKSIFHGNIQNIYIPKP